MGRTISINQEIKFLGDMEHSFPDVFNWDILQPMREMLTLRLKSLTDVLKGKAQLKLSHSLGTTAYSYRTILGPFRVVISRGTVIRIILYSVALADKIEILFTPETLRDEYYQHIMTSVIRAQDWVMNAMRHSLLSLAMPRERWRTLLAYTIAARGLDFILAHEAGHILRGHLALSKKDKQRDWQLQVVESQADDHATIHWLDRTFIDATTHNWKVGPFFGFPGEFAFSNKKDYATLTFVAIVLAWVLVSDQDDAEFLIRASAPPALRELAGRRYPPTAYRLWRTLRWFERAPESVDGVPQPEAILRFVGEAFQSRGHGEARLFAPASMPKELLEEYDHILMKNSAAIISHEKSWSIVNLEPTRPPPGFPI
jgi:hypothetical protein